MTEPSQTALLFPGQGSQEAGMREAVAAARPDLLELACELVGEDPFERVDEGTRFAQPAIYCASLAGWELAGAPDAGFAAGHSLGELAALVAAGALRDRDGLALTVRRGAEMQAAAQGGDGGMLALLGDGEAARELATRPGLTLANDNAPEQLVVSGHDETLAAVRADARERGLRALRLPILGAFHSAEMEPARAAFRDALRQVRFSEPRITVISCASAREFADPPEELAAALVRPVRWRATLAALREHGVERFLETGPGQVLTRLLARNPEPSHA